MDSLNQVPKDNAKKNNLHQFHVKFNNLHFWVTKAIFTDCTPYLNCIKTKHSLNKAIISNARFFPGPTLLAKSRPKRCQSCKRRKKNTSSFCTATSSVGVLYYSLHAEWCTVWNSFVMISKPKTVRKNVQFEIFTSVANRLQFRTMWLYSVTDSQNR